MFVRRLCDDENVEGFSPQVTEVLRFAQNESKRLRHNFIGTEQLLLGLIAERTSFSAQLLQSMGVNLWKAQAEVQKIIGYGFTLIDRRRPLTPRAKRVLKLASEEAARLGDHEMNTEHLLLSLSRERDGACATVLRNLEINLDQLAQQILEHLEPVSNENEQYPAPTKISSFNRSIKNESSDFGEPGDLTSGAISARLSAKLLSWVEPHQLGRVVVQTGFWLPSGNVLVPRLAFISQERLKRIALTYPALIPNLVVEVKSAFDQLPRLDEKIQLFLEQGTQVGLLIEPDEQLLTCYRPEGEVMVLRNGEVWTVPELLPGLELPVSELWPH
ncbi:MAG TPA: Clp protease N-terminal domain-containing protein [Coleofasciculaceae cyanobacterium]